MATLKQINKDIKHIKRRLSHLKLDVYALEASEYADEEKKTKLYESIKLVNKELEKKLLEKTEGDIAKAISLATE